MPDILGHRERIGIIVPSANTTVGLNANCSAYPALPALSAVSPSSERPLSTEKAFGEHMTTMHEGPATDQVMTGGLFGAIVAY